MTHRFDTFHTFLCLNNTAWKLVGRCFQRVATQDAALFTPSCEGRSHAFFHSISILSKNKRQELLLRMRLKAQC